MFASRAVKPKLSLSIVPVPQPITTTTATAKRPMLSLAITSPVTPVAMAPLRSPMTPVPMAPLRSPMSPLPQSPTARNTKINARGYYAIAQQPPTYTYAYANNASSRSILKKSQSNTSKRRVAQLQFREDPVVYSVSPIEEADYYGGYTKMSRDDRKWTVRS